MKKVVSLLLVAAMLLASLASCAADQEEEKSAEVEQAPVTEEEVVVEEEVYVDPFADFDYDGRTFNIYTSINEATVGVETSNYLIEGYEEFTGDLAPDAAIQRNYDVMELLNIDLAFEEVNYSYDVVATNIRTLLQSGDSTYQLIINDIYGLVPITPEGLFHNCYNGENFDFSQGWWYDDFMNDISLNSNYRTMLAGDYFIDLLRCTHCLIMNKDIYTDMYGDPNDVYNMVLEGTWTYDNFNTMVENAYIDANGNGSVDKDDQFGFVIMQEWGPSIPLIISADPDFIERDAETGYPTVVIENERGYRVVEELVELYSLNGTGIGLWSGGDEQATIDHFISGGSLFIGYQRLGSLENANFRETEIDLAVLPYPKTEESDDYVTSTHDTAELGFIPISVPNEDMSFVSACIEVLCRETNEQVLPAYYESSLKIKYTRDNVSAQMIDIIHDHFDNGFALAWSNGFSGALLNTTFYGCISARSTDLASKWKSYKKVCDKQMTKYIEKLEDAMERES